MVGTRDDRDEDDGYKRKSSSSSVKGATTADSDATTTSSSTSQRLHPPPPPPPPPRSSQVQHLPRPIPPPPPPPPQPRMLNPPSETSSKGISLSLSSGAKRPLPMSTTISQPLSKTSAFQLSKSPRLAISLPSTKEKPVTNALPVVPSSDVKKVFNDDDDEDEVEEIPLEARIRMRNKGRDNPTACGPNSYGKTRLGFCDYRSMQERDLEEKAKELCEEGK